MERYEVCFLSGEPRGCNIPDNHGCNYMMVTVPNPDPCYPDYSDTVDIYSQVLATDDFIDEDGNFLEDDFDDYSYDILRDDIIAKAYECGISEQRLIFPYDVYYFEYCEDTLRNALNQGMYSDVVEIYVEDICFYKGNVKHIPWYFLGMDISSLRIRNNLEIYLY